MELWRSLADVVPHGINYEVSNLGNLRNVKRGISSKQHIKDNGYVVVHLSFKGSTKSYYVHRLVMLAFTEQPPNKIYVNHIDGEKLNNTLDNLAWVTAKENTKHAWETGLMDNEWYVQNARRTGKLVGSRTIRKAIESNKKIVLQYALSGNLMNSYPSIQDAAKADGVSHMIISRECNRMTKRRTRNYYFRFAAEA